MTARPSASARYVARIRASLPRPSVPGGDAAAEESLYATLADEPTMFERFIAARTAFFDRGLLAALEAGARQVVIAGAGYDGRALRFRTPGVSYLEIDLPATQQDKRRRLAAAGADAAGIEFVPADLEAESADVVLGRSSHDRARASVYLCEGLLPYLPYPATASLLRGLRSAAAAGSTLLVSFPIGTAARVRQAERPTESGEYRRTRYTPAGVSQTLHACGWCPVETEHPDRARAAEADVAAFVRAVPAA